MHKKKNTTPIKTVTATNDASEATPEEVETYNLLSRIEDLEEKVEQIDTTNCDQTERTSKWFRDLRNEFAELDSENRRSHTDILKGKDLDFKQKLALGGIYLATAALSVYGIVKLARMPKSPPANLFIGELSNEAASSVLGEFTEGAKAAGAKVVMDVKHSLN